MAQGEKRRWQRRALKAQIELSDGSGQGELVFETRDLSSGGAFLKSDLLLEVGETFWISFCLPDTKMAVRTRGKVVRVIKDLPKSDPRATAGMGIQFLDMNQAERAALEAFLSAD